MNAIFLDTVGMLAVWDVSDQWHSTANAAFEAICSARLPVVTTSCILLECGNAAARRPYRNVVVEWRDVMSASNGIVQPTEEDWAIAWREYVQGGQHQAGLVDQISFAVMRRLSLTRAFTNDRHFTAAGFETLF